MLSHILLEEIPKVGLLSPQQKAFTAAFSTVSNLFETENIIADHVDKQTSVDVIYLDFQKAFDKLLKKN